MTTDGIKITDLRPEIQTLVNSDPVKYDPNSNGAIDDGDEISFLLSEYQCTKSDLTKEGGEKMWTLAEQVEIRDKGKENSAKARRHTGIVGTALSLLGIGAGTRFALKKGVETVENTIEYKELVKEGAEKLVKDGSYNPAGRPAYDIGNHMIQHISEQQAQKMKSELPFTAERKNIVDLDGYGSSSSHFARDMNGKPFVLRAWKPGDPQFVGPDPVEVTKYKTVTNKVINKKLIRKGVGIGLVSLVLGVGGTILVSVIARKKAENDVKTDIKAIQTADGERIMQQRRAQEEEMRQREEALKAEELEYKERMEAATQGIEDNINKANKNIIRANQKAKDLNKELDEIREKTVSSETELK